LQLSEFKWPPPCRRNIKHTPCYQRLKHILATHLITQKVKSEKAEALVPYLLQNGVDEEDPAPKMRCLTFQLQRQMETSVATRTTNNDQAANALQSVDNYL